MNTVNVIEVNGDDGLISSLNCFYDTKKGNEQAEKLFTTICKETTDLNNNEIETRIESGFADVPGGATIQIVHSTNVFEELRNE